MTGLLPAIREQLNQKFNLAQVSPSFSGIQNIPLPNFNFADASQSVNPSGNYYDQLQSNLTQGYIDEGTHANPSQLAEITAFQEQSARNQALNDALTTFAKGGLLPAIIDAVTSGVFGNGSGGGFQGYDTSTVAGGYTGTDPGGLMGSGFEGAGLDAGYADSQN